MRFYERDIPMRSDKLEAYVWEHPEVVSEAAEVFFDYFLQIGLPPLVFAAVSVLKAKSRILVSAASAAAEETCEEAKRP